METDRMERTVWMQPVVGQVHEIKRFFEEQKKCGIVVDIRIRKGPKWPNRNETENKFAMIEFADPVSCSRALQVASKKKALINYRKFKIFKAGTGTYLYTKKTSKQKKAETSKTNFIKQERQKKAGRTAVRGGRGGRRNW